MDSKYFVELLYETHKSQTSISNPPFSYAVNFDSTKFNKEKYILISKSTDELDKFVNDCFIEFTTKHPNIPNGSVHINPKTWTKFALKTIALGYKNTLTVLVFPNGCCSQGSQCPINIFYQIVLDNIMV